MHVGVYMGLSKGRYGIWEWNKKIGLCISGFLKNIWKQPRLYYFDVIWNWETMISEMKINLSVIIAYAHRIKALYYTHNSSSPLKEVQHIV